MVSQRRDRSAAPITDWWQRHANARESAADRQLLLFVRSLRPPPGTHAQRNQRFKTLREAGDRGRVDGVDVRVTGEELCLCAECGEAPGGTVREAVRELADWSEDELTAAGFRRRTVNSSFTDEQYRVLVPPETVLGIYLDGSLAGVFPCTAAGNQYAIETYLAGLVDGRPPTESPPVAGRTHHLTS